MQTAEAGNTLKYKAGQALFGDIPIGALNYIWDGKSPIGTIVDNAFTDFAKMIVVQSGAQRIGSWVEEERDVYQDYKLSFGEEPPAINGCRDYERHGQHEGARRGLLRRYCFRSDVEVRGKLEMKKAEEPTCAEPASPRTPTN